MPFKSNKPIFEMQEKLILQSNSYGDLIELIENHTDIIVKELPLKIREYALIRETGNAISLPSIVDFDKSFFIKLRELTKKQPFYIRDLLTHDVWPIIVFASFFSSDRGKDGLLVTKLTKFREMNKITRGGINLYKRDGWGVHVIMGLYLSNYCIPNGIPPYYFEKSEVNKLFLQLKEKYNNISEAGKIIYRIGTLIHDYGVVDSVQTHDIDGIKHVGEAIIDLDITEKWLSNSPLSKWRYDDFEHALKTFIKFHAMPSKVFGEIGIKQIKNYVDVLKENCRSKEYEKWLYNDLINSLSLFILGDVFSVRDEYLTSWKIYHTLDASETLYNLIKYGDGIEYDYKIYGEKRLCELLGVSSSTEVKSVIKKIILDGTINFCGKDYSWFITQIGEIERLDYALASLKSYKTPYYRAVFLLRLLSYINEQYPKWIDSNWKEIRFDADLDNFFLEDAVEKDKSFKYIIDVFQKRVKIVEKNEGKSILFLG